MMRNVQTFRSLIVQMVLLALLVFNTIIISGQIEEFESDVLIFVNKGALTIYNNETTPISLEGFQLSVVTELNDIITTSLSIRFDIKSDNYFVLPGACLVYLYDDTTPFPDVCKENTTRTSKVGEGDHFWMSDEGEQRLISVFRNNSSTNEFCPADQSICPIYYSTSNDDALELSTTEIVDTQRTRFIPENHNIPSVLNQSSNSGPINIVTWSPNDNLLISGHSNGKLCVWLINSDPTGITATNEFCDETHQSAITSIDWLTTDELIFASGSVDGHLVIWEVMPDDNTYTLEPRIDTQLENDGLKHIDWHPDNNRLLVVQNEFISIADVNLNEGFFDERQYIIVNQPAVADWRRGGRFIASISEVGVAQILDSSRGNRFENVTLGTDFGEGIDIAWNPQFDSIITADQDNKLRQYDYVPIIPCENKGCAYDTVAQNLDNISDFAFSSNGTQIAIGLQRSLHIVEAQKPYRRLGIYNFGETNQERTISSVTWSPDDSKVATGDTLGNLSIWMAQTEMTDRIEKLSTIQVTNRARAVGMAWNKFGSHIAVVDLDRVLEVWDVDNGEMIDSSGAHTDTPISIDWNESRNMLATGGCGPMVNIWRQQQINRIGRESDTIFCAVSLDFKPIEEEFPVLAIADKNGTLRIWDVENRVELEVQGWDSIFSDIEWDSNGERIGTTGENGALRIFNVDLDNSYQTTEAFVRQPETGIQMNSLAWSTDNQQIATASDSGKIVIWSLDSPANGSGFEGGYLLEGHDGAVESLSWSPVNELLASVGSDNRLLIWDTHTGQILVQEFLDVAPIEVKWSPSDSRFAILDNAGQVTIWQFLG